MSKFNKKRIKPQLNTNYKLFGWLGSWIEEIENRLDNINGDGVIDTIENSIKNIWSKIYNLENKHDNEMRVEAQVRKDNDDFLQNQINTLKDTTIPNINDKITNLETKHDNEMKAESQVRKDTDDFLQNQINTLKDTTIPNIDGKITNLENKHDNEMKAENQVRKDTDDFLQNQINTIKDTSIPNLQNQIDEKLNKEIQDRIAGDNAINKRIDDIQFLKWLVRLEFGADDLEQKMLLQGENWVKYFELPENYQYTRCYIVSEFLIINTRQLYHGEIQLLDYGLKLNLVSYQDKNCLEVTYTASDNKHGHLSSTDTVVIDLLLTQWYYEGNE